MASIQEDVFLMSNDPFYQINQQFWQNLLDLKITFIEVFSENILKNHENVHEQNVDALVSLFFQESVCHIKLLTTMANTTLAQIGSLSRKYPYLNPELWKQEKWSALSPPRDIFS